ncbi:hypothetical protein K435DRAFT_790301 [Dendrothele bispora CBS 962.96]|uniref:RRM domain-containing protein n=1 Tax=Dendrothele bispora (strain CBS 962.96) TaxID=1314807 RepID=A0A4S8MRQ5_DENBC|nr:hypothetical protein K435DRAFT_790301 [Dendrothele bispora CBS 962.96]
MDNENRPGLLRVGRKRELDEDLLVYYDRLRKRELYLEDKPPIPRELVHDIEVFGLPGPVIRYWTNDLFQTRAMASNWIYTQKKPKTAGLTAGHPDPSLLPRLESLADEPTAADEKEDSPMNVDSESLLEPPTQSEEQPETMSHQPEPTPPRTEPEVQPESSVNEPSQTEPEPLPLEEQQPPSITPPYPNPPSPNLPPFDTIWREDFINPIPPKQAPTMLIKFLGFHDVSLDDFRAVIDETLEWLPVKIAVTRIIRISKDEGFEFWTKFFDGDQAAWAIRAYHRFWTTDGYMVQLKLITLEEWYSTEETPASEEWLLTQASKPGEGQDVSSSSSRQNRPLAERLQDPPNSPSLMERIGAEGTLLSRLEASSAQPSKKRKNRRGGARKHDTRKLLGPLPIKDPENINEWNARSWVMLNCPVEQEGNENSY